jgi:hypothetical protein
MSTIFLDPVEMDATAGHVGDHVREVSALAADLESACSAVVPASLAVWLAEELHDIAVTVQMIALLYSLAALDTAQRAEQIQADQSLAAAAPALASATPTFTGAPLVGGGQGYLAGQVDTSSYTPTYGMAQGYLAGQVDTSSYVPTYGMAHGMLLGASGPNTPLGGYTPVLGGSGSQVHWGWNSNIANILAPRGLSAVSPGIYVDQFGHQGTIGQTVRNPRDGSLEF